MPRFASTALLAGALAIGLAFGAGSPCEAQTLRLDPVPPPPRLAEVNAATRLAELLQQELRAIEALQVDNALAGTVHQARVTLRRLAYDLLVRAGKAEGGVPTTDTLAMQGFRLADARRRVDLNLTAFVDGSIRVGTPSRALGVRERDRVGRLLATFVDVGPKALGSADLTDLTQVDAALATAIGPLCDALAILDGTSTGSALGNGWPTPDELAAVGGASSTPSSSSASDGGELDPCAPEVLASLTPLASEAIAAACGDAAAGGGARAEAIHASFALARAAGRSTWLSDSERQQLDAFAAHTAKGEANWSVALAKAELLDAERGLAEKVKAASYDVKALQATVRTALLPPSGSPLDGESDRLARQTSRIAESLRLATQARTPLDQEIPRDLRPLLKEFERAYARVEETTFKSLPRLITDQDAATSPELVGLVRGQRDALEDLSRLASARGYLDRIGGVRPQAVRGVTSRLKTMLRWLLEPARRTEGLTAWSAFSAQIGHYTPMPFEEELRRGSPEAIRFAGGDPRELVQTIDLARANWADGWAEGSGSGKEAQSLHALWRLCRAMRSLAEEGTGPGTREQAPLLSRWGGFHATRAAFAPALTDVTALTKLATQAAIAGDQATLDRELERIERDAPLAQLTGRLVTDLAPWLADRPDGVLGSLCAIRAAPREKAWGLQLRTRLATITRYARELEDARRVGGTDLEKPMLEYLRRVAESTLESLGVEQTGIVPLPGLVETESANQPSNPRNRRR